MAFDLAMTLATLTRASSSRQSSELMDLGHDVEDRNDGEVDDPVRMAALCELFESARILDSCFASLTCITSLTQSSLLKANEASLDKSLKSNSDNDSSVHSRPFLVPYNGN